MVLVLRLTFPPDEARWRTKPGKKGVLSAQRFQVLFCTVAEKIAIVDRSEFNPVFSNNRYYRKNEIYGVPYVNFNSRIGSFDGDFHG